MSLGAFSLVYDSLNLWLGTSWLAWVGLAIAMLTLFAVLLRVNMIVLLVVLSLPFVLLLAASIIVIPYGWAVLAMVFGLLLAIGIHRLFVR